MNKEKKPHYILWVIFAVTGAAVTALQFGVTPEPRQMAAVLFALLGLMAEIIIGMRLADFVKYRHRSNGSTREMRYHIANCVVVGGFIAKDDFTILNDLLRPGVNQFPLSVAVVWLLVLLPLAYYAQQGLQRCFRDRWERTINKQQEHWDDKLV